MKPKLTGTEDQVLTLLLRGASPKEVCKLMYIAKTTLATHRANLYDKLQVNSLQGMILRAIRLNLIPLREIGAYLPLIKEGE